MPVYRCRNSDDKHVAFFQPFLVGSAFHAGVQCHAYLFIGNLASRVRSLQDFADTPFVPVETYHLVFPGKQTGERKSHIAESYNSYHIFFHVTIWFC